MTGVRKDGDIKNCTSKMWGGASRLRAPKVKTTPERNLHSQLSPTTDGEMEAAPGSGGWGTGDASNTVL